MKGYKLQRTTFMVGVGMVIISLIILLVTSTVLKNWVVIAFGVKTLFFLRSLSIGCTLAGLLFVIAMGIPLLKAHIVERREQKRASEWALPAENGISPEYIRGRFESLKYRGDQKFKQYIDETFLTRMDKMDLLQAKQDFLIKTNDAKYLEDTIAVLDNVERRICQNLQSILNLLVGTEEDQRSQEKTQKYLNDTDKKLSDAQELVNASVDWINQCNSDSESDRSEVENWIAVIRESLKEG